MVHGRHPCTVHARADSLSQAQARDRGTHKSSLLSLGFLKRTMPTVTPLTQGETPPPATPPPQEPQQNAAGAQQPRPSWGSPR